MFGFFNVYLINRIKNKVHLERPKHIRKAVKKFIKKKPEMDHPAIIAAIIFDFEHEYDRLYPFADRI